MTNLRGKTAIVVDVVEEPTTLVVGIAVVPATVVGTANITSAFDVSIDTSRA